MDKEPSRTTRPTAPPTMSTPSPTPNSSTPPDASSSSASASATCPRCARPIPAHAALGACPHCLLAAGFASEPAAPDHATPPPNVAELAPEFPQLDLLELLGRGGMGAVYKARQKSLDRLVALKLLRPGLDADPSFAERFTREARALAQLNHPGIVTLYEFGQTPGGLFFILMEFVDGLNLRQLLAAGRLSPREALAIIPPLCDALQYAHDRGLIHRDIKPENILIDRLGRVKIADFGLAKLTATASNASAAPTSDTGQCSLVTGHSGLTETGKTMGTPEYMAPEQRERPDAVDHRADIYALGVVLYQLLTGELPDAKQLQPPSQRVHLDIRLDAIVLRALEANPSLRFAAVSELKTQLETVASSALPPPPPGAPTSPSASAASSADPTSPANSISAPSAPPPFRLSAISSRPRLKFWLLRVAPLSLLVMLALRFFVIAPYTIEGSSVEPEIPAGSLAFVYKLTRHYSPGDIVAYHHSESLVYVARVTTAGALDGTISITRKDQSPTPIPASAIIGKVVFNTRYTAASPAQKVHPTPPLAALNASQQEILRLKLAEAKNQVTTAKRRVDTGLTNRAELHAAQDEVAILEAELAGDRSKIAQIKIAAAKRRLNTLNQRYQAGVITSEEVSSARDDVAINEAELRGDKLAVAQIKVAAAERRFTDLNERHKHGVITSEEVSSAKTDLAIRRLELDQLASENRAADVAIPLKTPSIQVRLEATPPLFSLIADRLRTIVEKHKATLHAPQITQTPDRLEIHDALPAQIPPAARFELTLDRITRAPATDTKLPIVKNDRGQPINFTTAAYDEKVQEGVRINAIIDSRVPQIFQKEIMALIGLLHSPRLVKAAPNGSPLTIYAENFSVEKGISLIERLADDQHGPRLRIHFDRQGAFRLNQLSQIALGRRIVILFDGRVLSSPHINAEINGRFIEISPALSGDEMKTLLAQFPSAQTPIARQAETWLQLIDDRHYAQSWSESSPIFQQAVDKPRWTETLNSLHTPLGPRLSRQLRTSELFEVLPNTPGGPHFLLQFSTRFEQKPDAVETVTFTRDTDGEWRASGYYIK